MTRRRTAVAGMSLRQLFANVLADATQDWDDPIDPSVADLKNRAPNTHWSTTGLAEYERLKGAQ